MYFCIKIYFSCMKKLSIIVPVFNVEQYIRSCVESIFDQGLAEGDFQVILVNDGTQDDSFEQIKDVVESHANIRVVEQENQGLSAARNTGLRHACGQYVLFLDSDDLLIPNSLPRLLRHAQETGADMIVADYVKMTDKEVDSFQRESHAERGEGNAEEMWTEKTGEEVFLTDFNPRACYVWRTLYRKAFLDENNISFIPGIYFEDVPFTTECYLHAKKCVLVPWQFYIYRQRPNSIVSSMTMRKCLDLNTVQQYLWNMQSEHRPAAVRCQLMNTIFATFSLTVWYIAHDKALLLQRHDYVKDLKAKIPQLRFTNGLKQRAVSLLFRCAPSAYIWLRSL